MVALFGVSVGCSVEDFDAGGMGCSSESACPAPYTCEEVREARLCLQKFVFQHASAPSADYAGAEDTQIHEDAPEVPRGSEVTLRADGDDGPHNEITHNQVYPLLRWELTGSLPGAERLARAAVQFEVVNESIADYDIFALARGWDERATWLEARPGEPWATPGATGIEDRDTESLGTVGPRGRGPYRAWLNAQGVDRVRAWQQEPALNFGITLAHSSYDAIIVSSREDPLPSSRPALVLYYR